MNAPNGDHHDHNFEYQVDLKRREAEAGDEEKRSRRPNYSRGSSRPGAYNGIHRRRNKRWSW